MPSENPKTSYSHRGYPAHSLSINSEINLRLSLVLGKELFLISPHQSTYFLLALMFSLLNFEYFNRLTICWNLRSQHSLDLISREYLQANPQLFFNNDQAASFYLISFCSSFRFLSHSMNYLASLALLFLIQLASLFSEQVLRY